VLGVDLGGSNARAALVDGRGEAVAELAEATVAGDAGAVVAQLGALCRRIAAEHGVDWDRVAAAGVGVPGVVAGGALRLAPNLPSFGEVDLADALRAELGIDVTVDNDVNMATVGEHRRGLAAGLDDFVFVAVGTGVGMGVVAGGRLVRGATGAAGEIGDLPFTAGDSIEDAAGGTGLARRFGAARARDVYAAAASGDAAARALLDDQARALARAVVAAQTVLDPALVVFGGGIGSRDDVVARVRSHVAGLARHPVRIEPSALRERAGSVGAAEVALAREAVDA
jgi:predicted NBD/HSP70 family sugar kinase